MESNKFKYKLNKGMLFKLYTLLLNELNEMYNGKDNKQLCLSKEFVNELILNATHYPIEGYIDIQGDNTTEEGNANDDDYQLKEINYEYNADSNTFLFKGYPKGNLLLLLSNNILLCLLNHQFVFSFTELKGFTDQTKEVIDILNSTLFNQDKSIMLLKDSPKDLIRNITERGISTLLGLRKTPGSINSNIPLEVKILRESFNEANTKTLKSKVKAKLSLLTVGAKALSKHSHRSQTENFWPSPNGEEQLKNTRANDLLEMFIKECTWINIHGLPHQFGIIELRIKEGYGIRWQLDGKFRGFLEPPMENGHDKGWIH